MTANGTGCPAGTWDATLDPGGKTISVRFSASELIVNPGQALSIKDCTLAFDFGSRGKSFAVTSTEVMGYGLLDQAGMSAYETVKSYFRGQPVPTSDTRVDMTGPYDNTFGVKREALPADLAWSSCGDNNRLTVQTRTIMRNNPQKTGSGYINITTVDADIFTLLRFGIATKACTPPPGTAL